MAKQYTADIVEARIEHLTKEIETVAANVMTFRTRMGFTVLVGPFIVMGSVLIATKGEVAKPTVDLLFFASAIVAVASYVGMAEWGARFDKNMSKKCDAWRLAIMELSRNKIPKKEIIEFPLPGTKYAYHSGFALAGR